MKVSTLDLSSELKEKKIKKNKIYLLENNYFFKCCECARGQTCAVPPRVTLGLTEVRSRASPEPADSHLSGTYEPQVLSVLLGVHHCLVLTGVWPRL